MNKKNNLKEMDVQKQLEYANFIFEQVKFQQQARDSWFGHYLAIVGAVSGFSTITLSAFSKVWDLKILEICLGIIFEVTGIIGILFYFLFLTQRVNYKMHYRVLNELQNNFANSYLKQPYSYYYPANRTPFKKLKHGADYFASLIQRLLIAICAAIGCVLIGLAISDDKKLTIYITIGVFGLFLLILGVIHRAYDRVI